MTVDSDDSEGFGDALFDDAGLRDADETALHVFDGANTPATPDAIAVESGHVCGISPSTSFPSVINSKSARLQVAMFTRCSPTLGCPTRYS
jgi:hypothetical protein